MTKAIRPPEDQVTDLPPLGELYEIAGGRHLMAHRAGSGRPAVVIEAGAGAYGLDYLTLFNMIAEQTTCVIYDRAGTGWSDTVALPRRAAEVVADLHSLLQVMAVPGPYLLLGHSLGGVLVRRYAQLLPEEVVGLILVESAYDGMAPPQEPDKQLLDAVLAQLRVDPGFARNLYPQLFAVWESFPPKIGEALIARHFDPERVLNGLREISSQLLDEVRDGGSLPDIPVTVITGGRPDPGLDFRTLGRGRGLRMALLRAGLRDLGRRLRDGFRARRSQKKTDKMAKKIKGHAALAESMSRGKHRIFDEAGHFIALERPDLVLEVVQEMLTGAKGLTLDETALER
jgi:pimeloyl-ACP methyl ester carboxylesterase